MSIALGAAGDVFVTAGASDTSPPRKARSVIGNPFLFQGQYFDYDAGLAYMRARFYDPYTGQFLQRDPNEYEDSVNLYAGLGNNPSIVRDPSGTNNKSSGADILALIEDALAKTPQATSKATKIAKPAETTATELAAEIAQRATKRARGKTPPVLFRGVHMETTAALEKQLARGVLETPAGKIGGKAGKEAYKEEFQRVLESVDETVWERFAAGTDLRATGIIPNTTFSLGELILASPEERVAMQHILTSKAAVSTTPVMEFAANWAVRNKLSKEEAFVIEIRGIEEAQSPISRVRGTHGSRPINPCEGNEHVFTESIRFQEAVLYKVDPVTHATTEVWRGGPGYKK
jgi:RHS repeat-associated protein